MFKSQSIQRLTRFWHDSKLAPPNNISNINNMGRPAHQTQRHSGKGGGGSAVGFSMFIANGYSIITVNIRMKPLTVLITTNQVPICNRLRLEICDVVLFC